MYSPVPSNSPTPTPSPSTPELQTWIILPIFTVATLISIAYVKRRRTKKIASAPLFFDFLKARKILNPHSVEIV
jgi:hypothetical protein